MVETLNATDAAALLDRYDVVDVRDENEWNTGHIPGARLVPLGELRTDPDKALPRKDGIIFICAKGVRSLTAAKIAERLGYTTLFNLEGGTIGWAKAGLPIEIPGARAAA
jgi:rhodanese-related sulfurtransferase